MRTVEINQRCAQPPQYIPHAVLKLPHGILAAVLHYAIDAWTEMNGFKTTRYGCFNMCCLVPRFVRQPILSGCNVQLRQECQQNLCMNLEKKTQRRSRHQASMHLRARKKFAKHSWLLEGGQRLLTTLSHAACAQMVYRRNLTMPLPWFSTTNPFRP
jgi:hypothetical protein